MKTLIFNLIFSFFLVFPTLSFADNNSINGTCPGEIIGELDGASTTTSHTENGGIAGNGNDRYRMELLSSGTLTIDLTNTDSSKNANYKFYLSRNNCGNNDADWNIISAEYGKTHSHSININPNDTIYIRMQSIKSQPNNGRHNYALQLNYTTINSNPTDIVLSSNTINENLASGSNVGSFSTADTDAADTHTYTFVSGSGDADNSSFSISGNVLKSAEVFDFATKSTYSIRVQTDDGNGGTFQKEMSVLITQVSTESIGGRNFIQRAQYSLFGDVEVIGNSTLCILNTAGTACVEPPNNNNNAYTNLQKAPESYSTLTIPVGATVEYARLYWQGRKDATQNDIAWDAASKTAAATIKIRKGPTGTFTQLSADIRDYDSTSSTHFVRVYSASADASSVVNGSGRYYIDTASFSTSTGKTKSKNPDDGLGNYGAWTLVVVYRDPNEPQAKNITIFDGYKQVTKNTGDIDISVNGFLTPRTGVVDSETYVFTAEGDKYISGDNIKMAGLTYSTSFQTIGTFDSRVDVNGVRSPNLTNNNGIDIHKYNTGTSPGALNIIQNNETGAKFKFTSTQDTYFPSLIVFSTELYLPQLCYDYSIKQDGHYLDIDRSAYAIAQIDSRISSSDLDITVYIRNEEADIAAEGLALKSDINDTFFDFIGNISTSNVNGTTLVDRGTPSYSPILCAYDKDGDNSLQNSGCTNGHDIRKGNGVLDASEYIFTQYTLRPKTISGIGDINQSLGLSLKYYIVANGHKVEYPDYELGGVNVPLCRPSTNYEPTWGYFNVVQSNQPNNSILNNIHTQLSRNPFDAAVVFDSTPSTGNNEAPIIDINTTLLVEIIDVDSFGDINASCSNPDAKISESIFVPIAFTPTNFQTDLTTQLLDYYNFAVKNAAFRIWYFTHSDDTLIENWSATVTDRSKSLISISGLYESSQHTQCSSQCSSPNSTDCFECIKANYAQPICSRDNFSIRPESFDIRLFDVDKSLPSYNIDTDPNNQKNLTKIDLSTLNGYDPSTTSPTARINLAGGYKYRLDINATGHNGLDNVPGYTRDFRGNSNYAATMIWSPQITKSGCIDTDDVNLAFYMPNGSMRNMEKLHDNVGEYKINIFDNTWTAVDWQNNSHHVAADSFDTNNDCITSSSSSTASNNRYGCSINSNSGYDGHTNTYKDQDITLYPYKFNLDSIVPSLGLSNNTNIDGAFIYKANLSQDENMSLHLNGSIIAQGDDNITLTNFVTGCYAKQLDINLTRSSTQGNIAYQYRLNSAPKKDLNNSLIPIIFADGNFTQALQGEAKIIFNLNFDRNKTFATNPEAISYSTFDINCTNAINNCQFNADLVSSKTSYGRVDINATVNHYYARNHSPRYRFKDNNGTAYIYYEVFCSGAGCNQLLLQNGTSSKTTDDPRWFINTQHTNGFGSANSITQKNNTLVTGTDATGNHQDSSFILYNGTRGYPYKTTMETNSSNWLIYDKYDVNATKNSFEVEFINNNSSWAGMHETNSKTNTKASSRTNRRSMW